MIVREEGVVAICSSPPSRLCTKEFFTKLETKICARERLQRITKGSVSFVRTRCIFLPSYISIKSGNSSSKTSSTETSSVSVYCPFSIRESNNKDLFSLTALPNVVYISSSSFNCSSVIDSFSASNSILPRTMASGVCNSCEAFSINCFCSSYAL